MMNKILLFTVILLLCLCTVNHIGYAETNLVTSIATNSGKLTDFMWRALNFMVLTFPIIAVLLLITKRNETTKKILWLLIIIFAPLIGSLAFFIINWRNIKIGKEATRQKPDQELTTITIPLNEVKQLYECLEEINNHFHQPQNYADKTQVDKFATGIYPQIKELYYKTVWKWLPKEEQSIYKNR